MQWDLGPEGLAVLGLMSLGFGVFAGLVVGKGMAYRLWGIAFTTVACFGVGRRTGPAGAGALVPRFRAAVRRQRRR